MSNKKFMDLAIGDTFTLSGITYEKIADERINCCRVNNAKEILDPNTKIQVIPITEVEVN